MGFICDFRLGQPLISRVEAVESQVPTGAGYSGCWRRLWGRVVFPWGFVPEPRLRLFPAGDSEVPTLGSGQPGLRPSRRGSDSSPRPPPHPPLPLNPVGEEWSRPLSQDRTWGRRSCSWKPDPSCRGSLPPWGPVHPGTHVQPRPCDLRGDESQVGRTALHTALVPGWPIPSVECALAQRGPALLGG